MSQTTPFPSTAGNFYLLRDDRTNLYNGVDRLYADRGARVTADAATTRTFPGQVLLLVTCNLLARWCRRALIEVDDTPLHGRFGRAGSLIGGALDIMRDADPFGEFVHGVSSTPTELHIHLGERCPSSPAITTVLSCSSWNAAVRRPGEIVLPSHDSANSVGAVFAALLGGAQVFRDALGQPELFPRGFLFDGFSGMPATTAQANRHPEIAGDLSLGSVLMVGAGSVGSATAYFMDVLGLTVRLRLIDGDVVKVENFGRSPVFGKKTYGMPKAHAVAAAVRSERLKVDATDEWWDEFAQSGSLRGFDVVIPVANEGEVRWKIQAGIPPIMVHASTGRNWNVNFARHIPGRDDCLADRFAGLAEKPVFGCAKGKVDLGGKKNVDASLPFLSFFAGASIATDLMRLKLPGYPHTPNFGNYSFRRNRFSPQLQDCGPRVGCICRSQADAFWTFRRNTRFAYLSPTSWC